MCKSKFNKLTPTDSRDDGQEPCADLREDKDKLVKHERGFCCHPEERGESEVLDQSGCHHTDGEGPHSVNASQDSD